MRASSRTLCVAVTAFGLAGCAESTAPAEPEFTEQPGLVVDGPFPFQSLVTHEIVPAETPFLVTAMSFGSSSCTQDAGYTMIHTPARVEIRLRDLVAEGGACSRDLRGFPRHLIVAFDEAGTAEVILIGRAEDGTPREIRRVVTVQASE